MRVVVTGASGNIGTALLRRLTAPGSGHSVVGVVRRPPTSGAPYDAVEWVATDLAEPAAAVDLERAMHGADAVVHLAWGFQPSHDVAYLDRVGVDGTRAVLAAADAAGVAHLVHMSSLGAYAVKSDDDRIDETWPTTGIDTLAYSMQKAAAERVLDTYEAAPGAKVAIARLRPALVIQRDAGSALLRYGVPAYVPARLLRHVPILPVDRGLCIQVVHSDDVADAVVRTLERCATGAYNLAAEPPVGRDDVAAALGARPVHVPRQVLRALTDLTWRAHLQALDPGWLDLAFAVPLMDATRARAELGWAPTSTSVEALRDLLEGMTERAGTTSPVLRPRRVLEQVVKAVRRGPISTRRLP